MSDEPEEIDIRLQALAEEFEIFKSQQEANNATIADLRRIVSELSDIARLHQQGLRLSQTNADRDRAAIAENQLAIAENRVEIRRIWEYMFGQQQNNRGSR